MRRLVLVRSMLLTCAGLTAVAGASRADFPDLVSRVPQDANAAVFVDAEALFATPMAVSQGWAKKQAAQFSAQPTLLPPGAKRVVIAASLNAATHEHNWQLALIEGNSSVNLEKLAEKEKGFVDTIGNAKAAWSPRGAYVVKATTTTAAVFWPANRQFVSRWLKQTKGQVSDYIVSHAKAAGADGSQLVMVLDMEDLVQAETLRHRLAQFECLKDHTADVDRYAEVLATIKGVRFGVKIQDKATGTMVIDFGGDVSGLEDVAKPLTLEIMASLGATLNEMDDWTCDVTKNTITLEGELGKSGLLRLTSLFELPSLPTHDSEESAGEPITADNPVILATKNHFNSVQTLTEDVLDKKKEAKTFGQTAHWMEQYAKRIDQLPLLNVDEDMQAYSAEIAAILREMAQARKTMGIQTASRQAQVYGVTGNGAYGYDGARYYYDSGTNAIQATAQARRAISAQEKGQMAMTSTSLEGEIDQQTADIRRLMTERYQENF